MEMDPAVFYLCPEISMAAEFKSDRLSCLVKEVLRQLKHLNSGMVIAQYF